MSKIIEFPIVERQKRQIVDLEQRVFMLETTVNQLLLFYIKRVLNMKKIRKFCFKFRSAI